MDNTNHELVELLIQGSKEAANILERPHQYIQDLANYLAAHGVVVPVRCIECVHSGKDCTGKRYCKVNCDRKGEWRDIPDDFYCGAGERGEEVK